MHVVCFGEILWDNYKEGKKAGGAPLNVALHLHKNGIKAELISSVGKDKNGEELLQFINDNGLSCQYVQQHPALPTGIVEVSLNATHQAHYTILKPVAWDEIEFKNEQVSLIEKADAIIFGSLACRNAESRETLFKLLPHARLKVFDMNLRPPHFRAEVLVYLIDKCDVLKINEHELKYLQDMHNLTGTEEEILTALYLRYQKTICLTLGDKGAMILHLGEIYKHPGFPVRVADTVGAGDAFLATFICGILNNLSVEAALARGCAAGALVSSKDGANPDYSLSDLNRFLRSDIYK